MAHEWELRIHHAVASAIHALPKDHALAIRKVIVALPDDPRPEGSRAIIGIDNTYEVFLGFFRIVYEIDEEQRCIKVAMLNLSVVNP
ncbi:MAG: type II toxin-antitoxin system RelE/ParE family toxin [Caldilineaceae bacterium]|nr:type II toxin-antitoxin system RelE/ParE family toxin [Caldilineaceae bacterium]